MGSRGKNGKQGKGKGSTKDGQSKGAADRSAYALCVVDGSAPLGCWISPLSGTQTSGEVVGQVKAGKKPGMSIWLSRCNWRVPARWRLSPHEAGGVAQQVAMKGDDRRRPGVARHLAKGLGCKASIKKDTMFSQGEKGLTLSEQSEQFSSFIFNIFKNRFGQGAGVFLPSRSVVTLSHAQHGEIDRSEQPSAHETWSVQRHHASSTFPRFSLSLFSLVSSWLGRASYPRLPRGKAVQVRFPEKMVATAGSRSTTTFPIDDTSYPSSDRVRLSQRGPVGVEGAPDGRLRVGHGCGGTSATNRCGTLTSYMTHHLMKEDRGKHTKGVKAADSLSHEAVLCGTAGISLRREMVPKSENARRRAIGKRVVDIAKLPQLPSRPLCYHQCHDRH
jgi:hypothetical protein